MARARVAASDPTLEEGLERVIDDGGSAVDLVVAGFLASAAKRPGVLLGPVGALVAGVGMGARCFDGRSCQGGLDLPRPRGLRPEDEEPRAASAAVPRSLAALSVLHAYGGKRPMSSLARRAASLARKAEAPERGDLLEAYGRGGAQTLLQGDRLRTVLREAGPAAGGLLGEPDLRGARPGDDPATFVATGGHDVALPACAPEPGVTGLRRAEILVAADGRGQVAALAYSPDEDGLVIEDLGVALPRDGEPVRRGVSRVTPGTPRLAAMPIALVKGPDGFYGAVGVAGALRLEATAFSGGLPLNDQLEGLLAAMSGTPALGTTVQRGRTSAARCEKS